MSHKPLALPIRGLRVVPCHSDTDALLSVVCPSVSYVCLRVDSLSWLGVVYHIKGETDRRKHQGPRADRNGVKNQTNAYSSFSTRFLVLLLVKKSMFNVERRENTTMSVVSLYPTVCIRDVVIRAGI